MNFIGLDLSLNSSGWAHLADDGAYEGGTICPPEKLRGPARLEHNEAALREILAQRVRPDTIILIEDYVRGPNAKTIFTMSEWGGVARLLIWKMGLGYRTVSNISLKQFVTGNKDAKKDQMMLAIYKTWGREFSSNDAADAFGLALMAQALGKKESKPLTAIQKRALERVETVTRAMPQARIRKI